MWEGGSRGWGLVLALPGPFGLFVFTGGKPLCESVQKHERGWPPRAFFCILIQGKEWIYLSSVRNESTFKKKTANLIENNCPSAQGQQKAIRKWLLEGRSSHTLNLHTEFKLQSSSANYSLWVSLSQVPVLSFTIYQVIPCISDFPTLQSLKRKTRRFLRFQIFFLVRWGTVLEGRTWYYTHCSLLNDNVQHQLLNVKVICDVSILSKKAPAVSMVSPEICTKPRASLFRTLKLHRSNKKQIDILFCG